VSLELSRKCLVWLCLKAVWLCLVWKCVRRKDDCFKRIVLCSGDLNLMMAFALVHCGRNRKYMPLAADVNKCKINILLLHKILDKPKLQILSIIKVGIFYDCFSSLTIWKTHTLVRWLRKKLFTYKFGCFRLIQIK
jgi:hypothetical protein